MNFRNGMVQHNLEANLPEELIILSIAGDTGYTGKNARRNNEHQCIIRLML